MTRHDIIANVRREFIKLEQYGTRFYPCAVALTEDQKRELLCESDPYVVEVRFSGEGELRIWGLPVAIVPDSWKGPFVLVGVKS